jgi:shikimate dehydrogenase
MDRVYVAFRVRTSDLAAAVRALKSLGILGINVTMPHKLRVLRYLDRVDNTAAEIGAVNTVIRKGARLFGYNTDGQAAGTALSSLGSLSGLRALILGAGGAARAITYHLSKLAGSIVVLNRTRSTGAELASKIREWNGTSGNSYALNGTNLRREAAHADILINTLPANVFPRFGKILIQNRLVRRGMLVMDTNYRPQSDFLSKARSTGAKAADGLDMLVGQAALSFRLWTGLDAPIDIMHHAAVEARASQ